MGGQEASQAEGMAAVTEQTGDDSCPSTDSLRSGSGAVSLRAEFAREHPLPLVAVSSRKLSRGWDTMHSDDGTS